MQTLKHLTRPGVIGCIMCLLMAVNLALAQFVSMQSPLNSVFSPILSIVTLCLAIHLIRKTARLYGRHVWASASLITLIGMPIFNLLVIAVSFAKGLNVVFDAIASFFASTLPGMVVVVAFSIPMFLFYYFLYVRRKFTQNKGISVITVILCVAAAVFAVSRILYLLVTVLGMLGGTPVAAFMQGSQGSAMFRVFSLFVYLTATAGFVILQIDITKTLRGKPELEE